MSSDVFGKQSYFTKEKPQPKSPKYYTYIEYVNPLYFPKPLNLISCGKGSHQGKVALVNQQTF